MAPRFLDMDCTNETCGFQYRDEFFATVPNVVQCPKCHFPMRHVFLPRKQYATEWAESAAVVVFRDKNGRIRYPGRNDTPTPKGYERVVMRSLKAVDRFERQHGVVNEAMHFDRNGRGMDDYCGGDKI